MLNSINTKKQGDIGLGAAIAYFVMLGHTVCIPLTDSQPYDLVVDVGGKLHRVQVKTTRFRSRGGAYFVSLTVKGGNRTGTGKIKSFDSSVVDSVFVLTESAERYLIPSIECGNSLSLGAKFDQFRLPVVR